MGDVGRSVCHLPHETFCQRQRLCRARRLADEALIFRDGSMVQRLSREDLQAPDTLQALLEEIF